MGSLVLPKLLSATMMPHKVVITVTSMLLYNLHGIPLEASRLKSIEKTETDLSVEIQNEEVKTAIDASLQLNRVAKELKAAEESYQKKQLELLEKAKETLRKQVENQRKIHLQWMKRKEENIEVISVENNNIIPQNETEYRNPISVESYMDIDKAVTIANGIDDKTQESNKLKQFEKEDIKV